jgi:hypothetical protein
VAEEGGDDVGELELGAAGRDLPTGEGRGPGFEAVGPGTWSGLGVQSPPAACSGKPRSSPRGTDPKRGVGVGEKICFQD